MSNRHAGELPLGARAHTLKELAKLLAPRTLWYWLQATDLLAELQPRAGTIESDDPQAAPALFGLDAVDLTSLLVWEPNSPIRLKATPTRIVKSQRARRREIEGRRRALAGRLAACIRDTIGAPHTVATGIGPAGIPLEIPREMASQLSIDLDGNTLSTVDGGMVWRGVVVRAEQPKAPRNGVAPHVAQPRRRGPPARTRKAVVEWLAVHYPPANIVPEGATVTPAGNVLPEGVTIPVLQAEMKAADGLTPSPDTIRRALGLK